MPCLLVLNAAEGRLQAVLAQWAGPPHDRDERTPLPALLDVREWSAPSQGAELLAPGLRHMLESRGLSPKDVSRIACVRGPGGFTGLRLVLATAAGLARSTGALRAGLDYLPLLAAQAACLTAQAREASSLLWTATHARRDLVHLQAFALRPGCGIRESQGAGTFLPAGGVVEERTDLVALSLEEAETLMGMQEVPGAVLGSGLTRNRAFWEQTALVRQGRLALLPSFFDHPCPEALLASAATLSYAREDISPLYARPSDAEENLERIAVSLGLDPAGARQRLQELTAETP